MKTHIIAIASAALMIGIGGAAFAGPQSAATVGEKTAEHRTDGARGLDALVEEAMAHSPTIEAARRHWEAQTRAPIQAGTLPDPQITFQNFSVGDPGPGSGLGNSDFAYLGFGASQDLPFPGKLGLQAAMAQKDAAYARRQYEAARREVTEKVRELYLELSYHARTAALVHRIRNELERIAQIAETRYRVGEGLQQDVIKAQLQQTAMLKDLAMHDQEADQDQAKLKAVLGRAPSASDVEPGELAPSTIRPGADELRNMVEAQSPEVGMQRAIEERDGKALALARKGYQPDFSVGYMFQHTGQRFRDYYLLTIGARVPLYFWRKQTPAIEQAELELQSAHAQTSARALDVSAGVDSELVTLKTTERVLTIYREGLIPQARNSLDAALAAYRVSKVDFQTLLSALIDLLNVNQEYYRQVADHEIALARIEQVTGDLK